MIAHSALVTGKNPAQLHQVNLASPLMKCFAAKWCVIPKVVAMMATILCVSADPPEGLLEQLDADPYPERIAAEQDLQAWAAESGDEAREWLMERAFRSESPEVRARCMAVLRMVVLDELEKKRPGFVGINMMPVELDEEAGGGLGVGIRLVTPNSPADKAGLQANDVVIKIDGKGWVGPDALGEFAQRVGGLPPGRKIKLEVLRAGETKDFEVTLVARPWSAGTYLEQQQRLQRVELLMSQQLLSEKEAKENAFRDWLRAQIPREER